MMSQFGAHVARLDAGSVSGELLDRGLHVFRGIPFAQPPVGDLRWRAAIPPDRWTGVRQCDRFAPAPLQSQPKRRGVMFESNFAEPSSLVMSEDCLYLNVWTPDVATSGLPVMVWVPGGGNRFGWSSQSLYDGAQIARQGVVVVTMSYRLGPLGFLAHPELSRESEHGVSGNYALTDVLACLQWIQRNISSFGGDPARVTLAGNSA